METIIISTVVGVISNLIYDILRPNRSSRSINNGYTKSKRRRGPRWALLIFSVIPGVIIGAILAIIADGMGFQLESDAFTPSFYAFVGAGSVISYAILCRLFRRR